MYVSDPLLEAQREEERRRQETYGESPAWIRRVVQAYTRTEEYKWRQLLQQAARGSRADIPLGAPISVGDSAVGTSAGIPAMVSKPAGIASRQVPRVPIKTPAQQAASIQAVLPQFPIKRTTTMDLGDIVKTLGQQYIETRFGQARPIMQGQPAGPIQPQYVSTGDQYGVDLRRANLLAPLVQGGRALMGFATRDRIAAAIAATGVALTAEELATIATAASKTKCRRRRRRLATHADIKDIASLKTVFGSDKAGFNTWIATRKM